MVSHLQWIVGHDCEVRTPNVCIPHSNDSTYDTNIAYLICCFIFTQQKSIYFY